MYALHTQHDGLLRTRILVIHDDVPHWTEADVDLADPVALAYRHPVKGTVVQFALKGEVRIETDLDTFRAQLDDHEEAMRQLEVNERLGI